MGGHGSVLSYMASHRPRRILVLGTRLGEPTSFWNPAMIPEGGFIHVDIDADVPGVAYPAASTLPVRADIGAFVTALLERIPAGVAAVPRDLPRPPVVSATPAAEGRVRPAALMAAMQRIVIDESDALVLAECGNAFTWATHSLRFATPGRYRVSTGVGAMGHCAAGVVGAAHASGRKAVALVGDGAMLMTNEINTAVKLGAPTVWIVLNDARYNMCEQGMAVLGLRADATIPEVDFAMVARAMGADGRIVARESELDAGLRAAMTADGPSVLDVRIDPACLAPSMGRNRGLRAQVAASDRDDISFPPRSQH
jgi:acetolactate synthase-1/2/3 large subunit